MRLRQIALVSHNLDEVVKQLGEVLGLRVAYVDPNVGVYGLRNAVLPCGAGFLEVVEPTIATASAARFLARRGGDAGYMIILQVADAVAERDRAATMGVRVVEIIDRPHYVCAHFHPADFGGVLASFDQQRTETDHRSAFGDWMPAGLDWRKARTDEALDMAAVAISSPDPETLAQKWSGLLDRPLDVRDPLRLPLDAGAIRFDFAPGGVSASISALDIRMRDPAAALRRAKNAGVDVSGDGALIGGVAFRLMA